MRELFDALADARENAQSCARYARETDLEGFIGDKMRREAVCFCIIALGEAFNLVPRVLQNRVIDIPWGQVIGMRNRLVHQYWQIDFETVFRVANDDAQPLADRLHRLMNESV